jgi:RimJ/RimL family protein N-acetyltransferase
MDHRFYVLPSDAPIHTAELPTGYQATLWRPSVRSLLPSGVTAPAFKVWSLFHYLRVFANGDYGVLLITHGGRLLHRSGVYPRYFRFPFMSGDDLQIGDTWTDPQHRGRGLASAAVSKIVERLRRPSRRFWYLVEADNGPSVRVIERAGFRLAGVGERRPRLGIHLLGAFHLMGHPTLDMHS